MRHSHSPLTRRRHGPTPEGTPDSLATTEQRLLKGRFWWPSLLLLLVAGAPAQLPPDPPGPIVVGPVGRVVAGDTLIYTIRWGPGARATGYVYTLSVAATNGTWNMVADSNGSGKWVVVLPALPYTCPTNCVSYTWLKTWLTAVPWDSATFTFTVASQNSVGVSASIGSSWRVLRKPGVPGPIIVDSSLIVTGVLLQPPKMNLAVGQTKRVCAYPQFGNGVVATLTGAAGCDSLRLSLWMLPSATQQAHADSMCFTWASSNTAVATISAPPCTLGQLLRPALLWRVASRGDYIEVRP